ncbi:MAG: LD-carboxypeptidase [Terriglobia bacterium]
MLKPKALAKESTIGIFAPASPVEQEKLSQGVSFLNSLGYRTKVSGQALSRYHYFAGSHEVRAAELNRLFADPEVDAIFCARGGYGCVHLLPFLDSGIICANPKVFLGYSDVTVLLQYLEIQAEMVCFHGPMVAREFCLPTSTAIAQTLFDCLSRRTAGLKIGGLSLETLIAGTARGKLTGGCLSLIIAMLSTRYEINTAGKILFLEDINIKPYQFDRMLMQLKLAGKFDQVRGVVFGEMQNCSQDSDDPYSLQQIIMDLLAEFRIPILYGLPSGHTRSSNLTLPIGVEVTLDGDNQWLLLEESAVA